MEKISLDPFVFLNVICPAASKKYTQLNYNHILFYYEIMESDIDIHIPADTADNQFRRLTF